MGVATALRESSRASISGGPSEAEAFSAAQQLAEADPAGWAIGWGAWPALMRENGWLVARFRRAA